MKGCTTIWKRQTPCLTNRKVVEGSTEAPSLLIDRTVMMNSKRRKTNLSMAWIDYKKAFDMIPHSWLAEENTIIFLKKTMPNWKAILTSSGTRLAEVNIRRGIIQGDSLSPLLFTVAMILTTRVLERMDFPYQLEKGGSRINHLMFMDEMKLFRRGTKEIDRLHWFRQ